MLEHIRTSYLKFPVQPKIKETHFKILYDIYPSGEFLSVRFNFDMTLCKFCNSSPDDTKHIFFACKYSSVFWDKMQLWLKERNVVKLNLSFIDIK